MFYLVVTGYQLVLVVSKAGIHYIDISIKFIHLTILN